MKYFFLWCLTGLILSAGAKAADTQSNSFEPYLAEQVSQTRLSDTFLQKMQNCTPYQENKTADTIGITTTYHYEILGWKEGKCDCIFSSTAELGSFNNHCLFDKDELEQYTEAMLNLSKKGPQAFTDFKDPDTMTVMGMIYNPDICEMSYEGADLTAEFRKNLQDCTPYETTINMGTIQNTLKINGTSAGKCLFENIITTKAPDLSKLFPQGIPAELAQIESKDMTTRLECKLSAAEIKEYSQALEKAVLKGGNALDFETDDINAANEVLKGFIDKGICIPQMEGLFDHNP